MFKYILNKIHNELHNLLFKCGLFGIEISREYRDYGFTIANFCFRKRPRSLLMVYYSDGMWYVDLFWIHII